MSVSSPKLCIVTERNENADNFHFDDTGRFSDNDNINMEIARLYEEGMFIAPVNDLQLETGDLSWQLLSVILHRVNPIGFGIAVSGGRDNPHFISGDPAIVVSDVLSSGPAWGLVKINDRVLSANGVSLENAEYAAAIKIMRESERLNMIIKRRVPAPIIEFEQRTLKFTLSKSRKKEDFGIVLGCKYYIKEITNRKLAEKDPGLKEGDIVLRINGQSLEDVTFEEATKWLSKSREKLSLVVQRDVRRDTSRWPSQNTVYERLGSTSGTPRHTPSPLHNSHQFITQRASLDNSNYPSISQRYQKEHSSIDCDEFYRRNGEILANNQHQIHSHNQQTESSIRIVRFRKTGGSLGIRVIGGNRVGIFVSAVQEDSPAAHHHIKPGDRLLSVNEKSMIGITREEAVRHLLSLIDDIAIKLENSSLDFDRIRLNQLGDNFYIRAHFGHQKTSNSLELPIQNGDIFHITDTLFGGTVGLWQATKVYSACDGITYGINDTNNKGVVPNAETAENLARVFRADTSTMRRITFFRRKLKEKKTKSLTKNLIEDFSLIESGYDLVIPAYERVVLKQPSFRRPVVIYGPISDIARQLLLNNFAPCFSDAGDSVVRLSTIDSAIIENKHCILDVSPGSVERLQLAQYAPIVILVDVENKSRLREIRCKAGAPVLSSRKLLEHTQKIKKFHSHLLTATLDATKEDAWFDALRQLIAHLQDRRVWMPEFKPTSSLSDVVLFPMQNFVSTYDSDADSMRGDYSTTDPTRNVMNLSADPYRLGSDSYVATCEHYFSRGIRDPAMVTGRTPPITHQQNLNYGLFGREITQYQNVPDVYGETTGRIRPQNYSPSAFQDMPASGIFIRPAFSEAPMLNAENERRIQDWATLPRHYHQQLHNMNNNRLFTDSTTNYEGSRVFNNENDNIDQKSARNWQVSPPKKPPIQMNFVSVPLNAKITTDTQKGSSNTTSYDKGLINAGCSQKTKVPAISGNDSMKTHDSPSDIEISHSIMNSSSGNADGNEVESQQLNRDSDAREEFTEQNLKIFSIKSAKSGSDNCAGLKIDRFENEKISLIDDLSQDDTDNEPTVIEHVSSIVDSNGGTISCQQSGVILIVPSGAIDDGVHQEIYVNVCRADAEQPPLDVSRGESLMSPLVMCGPKNLKFNKSVELRLPRSTSNNSENWSIALKSGTGEDWNQIALDEKSLITDQYVSIKIDHF